jgi:uncharacterized hydrophobic protein (TIGR00341 family)
MALRLIEMACPEQKREEVDELVGQFEPLGVWHDQLLDRQMLVMILVPAEKAEAVLDRLESTYGHQKGFRVLLLEVQAAVPRPAPSQAEQAAARQPKFGPAHISRQELDAQFSASGQLNGTFLAMIVLSSVVAAIGMWRNNVAVIIGAMVIAPLLGPNIALAFATTLGNVGLGLRALKTALAGIGAALLVAVLLGLLLPLEGGPEQLASGSELLLRTHASLADIALALAAGAAGALAFTTGIHTPLVGVMVAVALLPPRVASGLSAGMGRWTMALGAFLLFLTNLICINLAGVATFLGHGIRPRTWWEADKARKASRGALIVWLLSLAALAAVIILAQPS